MGFQEIDYNLCQWFLDNPRDEFSDNPTAQQDFLFDHIVDADRSVKREYLMQMLDEMGVLNFNP